MTLMQCKGEMLHSFNLQYDFDPLNGIYFAKMPSIFLHHSMLTPLCFN